jgi:hypothetical protein
VNLNNNKKSTGEQGSILIYSVLMLGSILAITLSLAAIFVPKIRAISDAGAGSVGAIYAADSALEWCIYTNRANPALPQPIMANGATYSLSPNDCTIQPLNHRAIGTYRGVSRSLEVTIPTP